jgi:hypothetical protein
MTVPLPQRITCYIHAVRYMSVGSFPPVDVPAAMNLEASYTLVDTATGRTVGYLWGDIQFPYPGYCNYRGPFELAGAVRLAVQKIIADYYAQVYPDMVFVWYP